MYAFLYIECLVTIYNAPIRPSKLCGLCCQLHNVGFNVDFWINTSFLDHFEK